MMTQTRKAFTFKQLQEFIGYYMQQSVQMHPLGCLCLLSSCEHYGVMLGVLISAISPSINLEDF